MEVWVIEEGYDGPVAIADSEETATGWIGCYGDEDFFTRGAYRVLTSVDLAKFTPPDGLTAYRVDVREDGEVENVRECDLCQYDFRAEANPWLGIDWHWGRERGVVIMRLQCFARDSKHAVALADEERVKAMAQKSYPRWVEWGHG